MIEAYALLMDFVAKHLSEPFSLDGIQSVSRPRAGALHTVFQEPDDFQVLHVDGAW